MESEAIKVLLVDDDPGDVQMFRSMLAKTEHQTFQVDWVSTYEEAMDAFAADAHHVYFLDYFLEDRTGLDILKEARNMGVEAPIIMLTGRGSREVDMEAMDLGASDYLVKGMVDPEGLERAIRHAMERVEGAEGRQEQGKRLDNLPSSGTEVGGAGGGAVPAPDPQTENPPHVGGPGAVRWNGASGIRDASANASGSASKRPNAHPASDPADTPSSSKASEPSGGSPSPNQSIDSARFWTLFEATRTGVALVGLDGEVLKVNTSFAEIFSPTPRFTEGLSLLDLLHESDRDAVKKELEALAVGARPRFEAARRFLTRGEQVIWAHTTTVLIRNQERRPDHLMVLLERVEPAEEKGNEG